VAALPLRDRGGNALLDVRVVAEAELSNLAERLPMPASLVVVTLADAVLMMFNGWRGEWELPGGMRDPGETARQAAVRELAEETGIRTTQLVFAMVAEVDLVDPERREFTAVYRTELHTAPLLVVNDEAVDFRWWTPHSPLIDDLNPIDAEIARRVIHIPRR
jgi:8-oxo-dGTP pyrophosphatase MutT (NUDIX family)